MSLADRTDPTIFAYGPPEGLSEIVVGHDLNQELLAAIRGGYDQICVVTDSTVWALHGNQLMLHLNLADVPYHVLEMSPGEEAKSLPVLHQCLEQLVEFATRDSALVAFGGGVVGNTVGLGASLLYRGVPLIHVPTTYLAQCDSAIGSKQAVNGAFTKNAFGAFHTPRTTLCDIATLATLPLREWRSGLAESAKVGLAGGDQELLSGLFATDLRGGPPSPNQARRLIEQTLVPKVHHLTADPREQGALVYMELGHVLGHAVETAAKGLLTHGEAIAVGIIAEARLGMHLGLTSPEFHSVAEQLLCELGLPVRLPAAVSLSDIETALERSNARWKTGPRYVIPLRVGETKLVTSVPKDAVHRALAGMAT